MSKKQTIQQIIAASKTARSELGKLNTEIQEEIIALDAKVHKEKRKHTQKEKKRRIELRAAQKEIGDTAILLAYVTLQSLDESDEVRFLQIKMNEANNIIKDDLKRLQKIEKHAKSAAKVADAMAKVAKKLVELAAKIA